MLPINTIANHVETINNVELFSSMVYGISRDKLHLKFRAQEVVSARFLAFYLLKEVHGWTQSKIGRHFDMDHTSIMSGIKKISLDPLILIAEQKYISTYPQA